jgi:tetratricopeptide (TPR) repeat protein
MKPFLVVLGILCTFILCLNEDAAGSSGFQNTEVEIKAAICEIENGNFKAAQAALDGILKKEPDNVYALRLLPGIAARQIKQVDKSPENVVLIRKAIDAYEKAAGNPILKNDRMDINSFIIELYGMIGGDEKATALLKKAENESESPKQRAAFYTALAADNYACANDISDAAPVKSTVRKNGAEIYVFRKPQSQMDFDRLKKCASKGSELIVKAIALDPASDTAWSYRASLFVQLGRIAEMEVKPAEKARFMSEYETARQKFFALSRRRSDEQARISDDKISKSTGGAQSDSLSGFSEAELKEFAQELKTYRAERSLSETVDRVYIPFNLIVPISDEDTAPDDEKGKLEWKTFAPEGSFSADLPINANFSSTGDSRIYTASGSGLSFFTLETARFRELPENLQDAALNVLSWTVTNYIAGKYIQASKWNERFELELTRKGNLNNRPARFYAYRLTSCKKKQDGTMIFIIGKRKNYAIDIRGAGESDERVQRFLKSLKLD